MFSLISFRLPRLPHLAAPSRTGPPQLPAARSRCQSQLPRAAHSRYPFYTTIHGHNTLLSSPIHSKQERQSTNAGSAITDGREPRSCLGQVFNSKLGYIATLGSKCMVHMQPLLKLKTQPWARLVS
jgi:hypothetical protein